MITAFVKDRIRDGVSPRTANLDVIVLRNVLKSAVDDGFIDALPTMGIRPLKTMTKKRPAFRPSDFHALCAAAQNCSKNGEQLADYIRFLAFSGTRCAEALRITWADVDFERSLLCVGADGSSKNSKARYIDFNPDLERHLREMWDRRAPDTAWLFPSPQRGENDKPARSLRESFKLARKEAELCWVGFHDLRHHFASMAVMSGIDFKTIAEWLGHQDGGMLVGKVYGHLLPEHKQRMAERFVFEPSVVKFPNAHASTIDSASA
jgi:integrase